MMSLVLEIVLFASGFAFGYLYFKALELTVLFMIAPGHSSWLLGLLKGSRLITLLLVLYAVTLLGGLSLLVFFLGIYLARCLIVYESNLVKGGES